MDYEIKDDGMVLKINNADKKHILEIKKSNGEIISDNSLCEFFDDFIANSEFDWINPEEICALTDAPILGIKNENDEVVECFGFMDYQVTSILQALLEHGQVFMQKG